MSTIKPSRLSAPAAKAEPSQERRASKAAAEGSAAASSRGWTPRRADGAPEAKVVGKGSPFVTPDIPPDDEAPAKKVVGQGSPFVTPDIPPDDQ